MLGTSLSINLYNILDNEFVYKSVIYISIIILIFGVIGMIVNAYGAGPDDPACYELGECDFFQDPFDAMTQPFLETFGVFTYPIIWGVIMMILWMRVSNTMVVAIIGVALAAVFIPQFDTDVQIVGYSLLALAIGVALYQIITVRVHYPTN